MSEAATHEAIEAIARNSYGRLIAFLASRSGDVAGAEDALSEAFVAALERWPMDAVPERPEAWLLRVARNRLIDAARHNLVRQDSETFLQQFADEAQTVAEAGEHFPDERLKLLFVCAHPAIDPAARTPLMLQTVLGIDAARRLLALMLHCEARRVARFTSAGEFVPLDKQDTALWSQPMMDEAEEQLRTATTFRHMGRYQLEAAIQSIHASRAQTGSTDWAQFALLYEGLLRTAPGLG